MSDFTPDPAAVEAAIAVLTQMRGYRYRPDAQAEAVIVALVNESHMVPRSSVDADTETIVAGWKRALDAATAHAAELADQLDERYAALAEAVALLRRTRTTTYADWWQLANDTKAFLADHPAGDET